MDGDGRKGAPVDRGVVDAAETSTLCQRVRRELPPAVVAPCPARAWAAFTLVTAIAVGSSILVAVPLPATLTAYAIAVGVIYFPETCEAQPQRVTADNLIEGSNELRKSLRTAISQSISC